MGYMGWVWDIIFWVLLICLIIWLISKNRMSSKTPLDAAKMRYANGEITKKEFENIKKDIK